ncbi:MAG: hypothetical protein CSA97_01890 [Bacteroidetes bacterium]|nr:MAG: hypothetical protein CSA97_01890 [Bacteroidota bacterium]
MRRLKPILLLILLGGLSTPALRAQMRLTLDSALRLSLANSRDIVASQKSAEAADELRKSMWGKYFPRINLTAGYLRTNRDIEPLGEDMKIPVVPGNYINPETGALDQELIKQQVTPALMKKLFGQPLTPEDIETLTQYKGTFKLGPDGKPQVGPDGNPIFNNYAYVPAEEVKADHHNLFNVGVNVTQPIWVGGRIIAAHRMAKAGAVLAKSTVNLQEEEALFKTEKAYWQVVSLEAKKKVVDDYLEMIKRLESDVQNLVDEGIVMRTDLLRATVKRNEIELKALRVENGIRLAKMNLCQIIGLPMNTDIQMADSVTLDQYVLPEANYMDSARTNRAELTVLSQTVEMAKGAERMMLARFMPNIMAFGGYNLVRPNLYEHFDDSFGGDWYVGVGLQFPICTWGDRIHTMRMARLMRESAEAKYENAKERIGLQVQQVLFRIQEAQQRIRVSQELVRRAEINLEVTENCLKEGTLKTTDLLEAQAQWQDAQADLLDARTDLSMEIIELRKAAGQSLRPYLEGEGNGVVEEVPVQAEKPAAANSVEPSPEEEQPAAADTQDGEGKKVD